MALPKYFFLHGCPVYATYTDDVSFGLDIGNIKEMLCSRANEFDGNKILKKVNYIANALIDQANGNEISQKKKKKN